jgi:hypothetical protein
MCGYPAQVDPTNLEMTRWVDAEIKSFASNQKPRFSVPFPDAKI